MIFDMVIPPAAEWRRTIDSPAPFTNVSVFRVVCIRTRGEEILRSTEKTGTRLTWDIANCDGMENPLSRAVMTYPAPERNKGPILEVLQRVLPDRGTVLEIASGTGQHIVHFAQALPDLTWLPSDPEAEHRGSILARTEAAGLTNVAAPLALDVRQRPWPVRTADAILCINMIHIAPWETTLALLFESAQVLPANGVLYLYGPYRRSGRDTAPSNADFDADLRRRNPDWGVRNLEDVQRHAEGAGFVMQDVVAMPANNFSVVFRRS
jgi:SAM-dependent methyltransferase